MPNMRVYMETRNEDFIMKPLDFPHISSRVDSITFCGQKINNNTFLQAQNLRLLKSYSI